jgi:hypothetical protein
VNAELPARRPLGNPLRQHRSSNVRPLFHVRIHSCLTPFVCDGPFHPRRNYGSSCPRTLRNCLARPTPQFYSARYTQSVVVSLAVSPPPVQKFLNPEAQMT